MGLAKSALRFLIREHQQEAFGGSVLTLGRQNVYATFNGVCELLRSAGMTVPALPAGVSVSTNVPSWQGTRNARNTSDVAFFRLLGCSEVLALDSSPFEGAELIWDLNQPVPPEFENRFELILDGGTLEHVFSTRQALANVVSMLKVRGRVIHISPSSNYLNHGFYQFSPTLFYDYYLANRFDRLKAVVAEHNIYVPDKLRWRVREVGSIERVVSSKALATFFVATKTPESTMDTIPSQAFYRALENNMAEPSSGQTSGWCTRLWNQLSHENKLWLLGIVPGVARLRAERGARWQRL